MALYEMDEAEIKHSSEIHVLFFRLIYFVIVAFYSLY